MYVPNPVMPTNLGHSSIVFTINRARGKNSIREIFQLGESEKLRNCLGIMGFHLFPAVNVCEYVFVYVYVYVPTMIQPERDISSPRSPIIPPSLPSSHHRLPQNAHAEKKCM